jgi:hypothetical protein
MVMTQTPTSHTTQPLPISGGLNPSGEHKPRDRSPEYSDAQTNTSTNDNIRCHLRQNHAIQSTIKQKNKTLETQEINLITYRNRTTNAEITQQPVTQKRKQGSTFAPLNINIITNNINGLKVKSSPYILESSFQKMYELDIDVCIIFVL